MMMKIKSNHIWILGLVLVLALSLFVSPSSAQQEIERITLEITDDGIEAPDRLPLGTIILWVNNNSSQAQNIQVQGLNVDRTFMQAVAAGQTRTMRLDLLPGAYTFSTTGEDGGEGTSVEVEAQSTDNTYASGLSFFQQSERTPAVPITGAQPGQQGQQEQGQSTTNTDESSEQQDATPSPAAEEEGNGEQQDQQGGQDDQALIDQGEEIYSNSCASCHGQNGQGGVGPALAGNNFVTQDDPSPVIDTVLHGRGRMPAFEDQLSNEEIAGVVSFIRNGWDNEASTVSEQQVSQVSEGGSAQQDDQQQGEQQATVTPTGEGGEQQATVTPTGDGGEQQATQTPTGEDGEQQATVTPTGEGGEQQATPTPTQDEQQGEGQDQEQEGDDEVPVTGESPRGFSVADVAQPGQSGDLNVEIALVRVADGFNDPVNVVAAPDGSGRLFVVERSGTVRVVSADGEVMDEPFLDISEQTLDAFLEQGLYDLEFHPDFANNGRFYVHFSELLRNGDSMIVEYTVADDNENAADPESARVIMQIDQPWANHNGGELAFGPDGYLYIGSGDGGWEGDPLGAGQDLSTLLGKILRIDVDQSSGTRNYGIPEDNPFASAERLVQLFNITEEEFSQLHTTARPEIWAYGLRNPWKFQFDPQTGDLYLPDVGQNHWEEINFQPADSEGGENYGWDFLMGTRCFPIEANDCPPVGVLPVAEYSHDLGVSIVGLGMYRGDQFSEMDGIYFVGDWGSGRIWGLQRGDNDEWIFAELLDTDERLTGSGQAEDGTLYVTSCNCEYGGGTPVENQPGSLWRIVPTDQVPEGAETAGGQVPVTGDEGQEDQDQQGQAAGGSELVQTEGTVQEPIEESMPIGLEEVASGFTSPIFLTTAGDDSGRLFVVDQVGQVRIIDENGELMQEPFLDVSDRMVDLMEDFDERGLLGLAFHPEYEQNGRFFVYYSAPLRDEAPEDWNHTGRISEFSVSEDDENVADPDSERILLRVDEPQFNHDGGTLMFGPDGYLYISLGDGGDANDTGLGHVEDWYEDNDGGNAQNVEANLLGKILRIDVDSEGSGGRAYGIPEDNPFVGQDGMEEIYAYGLRNPYRFSFDRGGENQLFAADVGQNAFEEVSIIEAGGNYGWNVKEGTHCFSTNNPDNPPADCPDNAENGDPLIDPVIEYLNANQEGGIGISITGGFVYRGQNIDELQGNYIFGDWSKSFASPQGRLFMSEPQQGEGLWPIVELLPQGEDFNYFVMGFGEDENGELYVTTTENTGPNGSTGRVFRLVPAGDAEVPVTGESEQATPTPGQGQNGQQDEGDQQGGQQPTSTPTPRSSSQGESEEERRGRGALPQTGQGQDENQEVSTEQLMQEGGNLYGSICAACHMPGGVGVGSIPPLNNNPFVTQDDAEPVAHVVLAGRAGMPGFKGDLENREIAAIITFIRNAWDNDASAVTVDEISMVDQQIEEDRNQATGEGTGD